MVIISIVSYYAAWDVVYSYMSKRRQAIDVLQTQFLHYVGYVAHNSCKKCDGYVLRMLLQDVDKIIYNSLHRIYRGSIIFPFFAINLFGVFTYPEIARNTRK